MEFLKVILVLSFLGYIESKPYSRWEDYNDDLPLAKPVLENAETPLLSIVNPLRPYEPWVLECNFFHFEKPEPNKRHPRCQELDVENEKEYARFLLNVQKWEEAYPERAARWNERFPDAKNNEKKKYEQLKTWAEMHPKTVSQSPTVETDSMSTEMEEPASSESNESTTTQRMDCPDPKKCSTKTKD